MWFDSAFSLSQVVFQTSAAAPQQRAIDWPRKFELLTKWAQSTAAEKAGYRRGF
jgi:hypothetical protein